MNASVIRSTELRVLRVLVPLLAAFAVAARADDSFIKHFNTVTTVSSTVPANGDVNPYGIVRVPVTKGTLVKGNFLVSNFNNGANLQGTGTTIMQVTPQGALTQFAQIDASRVSCPGGVGLTTALVALRSGFVIVGSLPTSDGTSATAQAGCLIVLDSSGNVVETFSGHDLNGPWDMTPVDYGSVAVLFVTNVLNGTVSANGDAVNQGTVVRLLLSIEGTAPKLMDSTIVGSGFPERTDPAALVVGPTGVAFDKASGRLYVADSVSNRIAFIPNALFRNSSAGIGGTAFTGGALNDPLGLTLAPDRHLLVANGGDGNLVEIDPREHEQVAVRLLDSSGGPPAGAGALFGLVAAPRAVYFVDDATNTLNVLH